MATTTQRGVFLADAIDPATGDYRSIARGVDPVEAAVLEALLVQFKSGSAVLNDGNRLHEVKILDDAAERLLRSEVEWACRRLIEERKIELTETVLDIQGDTANLGVKFRNLSRMSDGYVTLPLLALNGGASL